MNEVSLGDMGDEAWDIVGEWGQTAGEVWNMIEVMSTMNVARKLIDDHETIHGVHSCWRHRETKQAGNNFMMRVR